MDSLQKDPAARPVTMEVLSERLSALGLFAPSRDNPAGSRMPSPVPGYPPAFYSSPPPGVPLLRTPIPGSMQAPPPTPPPPGPAPSPYPAPMPMQGGSPYPSPAPLPISMNTPGPGSLDGQTLRTRGGSGSRNLLLAVAGLVVIGGGVAIFAASRGGKSGSSAQGQSAQGSTPSGDDDTPGVDEDDTNDDDTEDETDVAPPATDFSITPERPLYDPGTPNAAPTPPVAPTPPSFDDGIWKGGWWRDPASGFQLDVPAGFSQTVALGNATQFAGSCGPVPCTIVGVSFPTPGQTIDVDQVKQMIGQLPIGTGAHPTNVRKQKIGGRRCIVMDFNNPDNGFAGEMAMCPGRGSVPAIAVQTFPQDFAGTRAFRSEFFGKRIKF
jgi:hypothetical protein